MHVIAGVVIALLVLDFIVYAWMWKLRYEDGYAHGVKDASDLWLATKDKPASVPTGTTPAAELHYQHGEGSQPHVHFGIKPPCSKCRGRGWYASDMMGSTIYTCECRLPPQNRGT